MNQPNGPTMETFERALKDAEDAVIFAREPLRPEVPLISEPADASAEVEAIVLSAWITKLLQEQEQSFRLVITPKDVRLLNVAMDAVLRRLPR